MKTQILTISLLLALTLSCNKKSETIETEQEVQTEEPKVAVIEKECFELVKGNDTITLSLTSSANNVNGELKYDWFEKDGNTGTYSGIFIGDTLFADYTFQSEGMTSVRETVFVKSGNTLVQGFGDMEEKGNKQVFKDPKKLKFDNSIVLMKSDCK